MRINNNMPEMYLFLLFIAIGVIASGLVGFYELFYIRDSHNGNLFKIFGLVIGFVLLKIYYKEERKRNLDNKEKKKQNSV
ncbi:hypothetical protein ACFFIX_25840 [Metabacillus herbersteinensis]|uniref:Uncharacterized protein n=1 Tax=Metabacillus herbersteinensis TaxID=283816 RepID=A0ABV6GMX8_9BACI